LKRIRAGDDPLTVLRLRFTSCEFDEDEYKKRKNVLEG